MSKLPTLFILGQLIVGGSERKTVRTVNALRRRGLDVHLGYLNGPDTLRAEVDASVSIVCFDRQGKFSWPAVQRLKHYVEVHGIARIVCINLYPLLYASALRLAMGKDAPSIVVSVNTTFFLSAKEALSMLIYTPLMWRVDRVVFGCDFQLKHWRKKYRLANRKCEYIYNGVDQTLFSPNAIERSVSNLRESFGLSDTDFVIGTVGQLRPEKHQRDLIITVQRLRMLGISAQALLVGSGSEEKALRNLSEELDVSASIKFIGELKDVRPALLACNVFALTSLSETFSNAALEAMAMGRAVVLSDAGGAGEMVSEGVNGFLFQPGDIDKLAQILALLAKDSELVKQMGQAARCSVEEKFSFSRMVDDYKALLPTKI